jgi:hypothetical protein
VVGASYTEVEGIDLANATVSTVKRRWLAAELLTDSSVPPGRVTLRLVPADGRMLPPAEAEARAVPLTELAVPLAQLGITDGAWLLAEVAQAQQPQSKEVASAPAAAASGARRSCTPEPACSSRPDLRTEPHTRLGTMLLHASLQA